MAATSLERQRGVSRVLVKLENSIETGNYYEAHQMYRTLYFRYISQRKFEECLDLLYNGSKKLAAKQQESSAADLGLLLVDTLEKYSNATNGKWQWGFWIEHLSSLIARLSASTIERETLIARAIKWSADMAGNTLGHTTMHKYIAQIFWKEGNIELARHHFLLSRDGNICGRILIKISEKGFASELDLFIVQAVLQQLCLEYREEAEETFLSYVTNHPQIRRKELPFEQPLLNFVYFMFRILESGDLNAFNTLCSLYKPFLRRDPSFEKYLLKISVIFLGAEPPSSSNSGGLMGGMFGDLFTRLFQGFGEDIEEPMAEARNGNGTANSVNELD